MTIPAPVPEEKRGSSWPLMLLAALSLIPLLGFFFGAAAAIWGLVTDRPRGVLAAALGGTGALLNIVILGAIGMSIANMTHSGGISAIIARTELDTLANHLDLYHQEHGRYPATLADLARGRKRAGLPLYDHSIGLLNVTTEYAYRVEQDGLGYDLRGAGRDGITDTVDDVFPTAHGDPWKGDSTSLPETGSDD